MALLVGTKTAAQLYRGTDLVHRYRGARPKEWSPAALWTPQAHMPGIKAGMDIRQGRTPASGATSAWAAAYSASYGDKSATQATVANQPVYGENTLGTDRPGLLFDGTDFLAGMPSEASGASRTIVVFASFAAGSNNSNRTLIGGTARGDVTFRRNTSRQMQVALAEVVSLATDTVAVPDDTPTILAVRYTARGQVDFWQNGRLTTSAAARSEDLPANATLQFGRAGTVQLLIGAMGCSVFAAPDTPSSDDIVQRAIGWVAWRNNAAGLLVDGHPYKASPPTL